MNVNNRVKYLTIYLNRPLVAIVMVAILSTLFGCTTAPPEYNKSLEGAVIGQADTNSRVNRKINENGRNIGSTTTNVGEPERTTFGESLSEALVTYGEIKGLSGGSSSESAGGTTSSLHDIQQQALANMAIANEQTQQNNAILVRERQKRERLAAAREQQDRIEQSSRQDQDTISQQTVQPIGPIASSEVVGSTNSLSSNQNNQARRENELRRQRELQQRMVFEQQRQQREYDAAQERMRLGRIRCRGKVDKRQLDNRYFSIINRCDIEIKYSVCVDRDNSPDFNVRNVMRGRIFSGGSKVFDGSGPENRAWTEYSHWNWGATEYPDPLLPCN